MYTPASPDRLRQLRDNLLVALGDGVGLSAALLALSTVGDLEILSPAKGTLRLPRTAKTFRVFRLPQGRTGALLGELELSRAEAYLAARPRPLGPEAPLFAHATGRPLSAQGIRRALLARRQAPLGLCRPCWQSEGRSIPGRPYLRRTDWMFPERVRCLCPECFDQAQEGARRSAMSGWELAEAAESRAPAPYERSSALLQRTSNPKYPAGGCRRCRGPMDFGVIGLCPRCLDLAAERRRGRSSATQGLCVRCSTPLESASVALGFCPACTAFINQGRVS